MVQAVDKILDKPVYNAVDIKVKQPEVNARQNNDKDVNDNGIYNAVKIDIDNPAVNPDKKIYDYPENNEVVTYEYANTKQIDVPKTIPANAYPEAEVNDETKAEVPAPNYTTVEAEKGVEVALKEETSGTALHFKADPQKPEIKPSESIKPVVNIAETIENLESEDYDKQAVQMAQMIKDPKISKEYIVKDIFTSLINITQKNTTKLEAPSEQQIELRKKLIANVIAMQQNPNLKEAPNKLTEEDMKIATALSPMEQAERNKEYALYTMAILAKIYTNEVQEKTGNVVPLTDIPGVSVMVDTLRDNPNMGVKIAAIDSLQYLAKPEYKDELKTIFSIAQQDNNKQVAEVASMAMEKLNNLQ